MKKEISIKSVENADLILRGEEKEAYLEFLEHGGFAEMRKEIFRDLEMRESSLRRDLERMKEFSLIKDAIRNIEYVGYNDSLKGWNESISSLCGVGLFKFDKEFYDRIFNEFYKYMKSRDRKRTLDEEFDKHYKLLHENIKEVKRLIKIEYHNKLEKYKQKVRNSFWRKVF